MGQRGVFHEGRVLELAKKFKVWREERLPGVRAFQSTYDRSVCISQHQFNDTKLRLFVKCWDHGLQVVVPINPRHSCICRIRLHIAAHGTWDDNNGVYDEANLLASLNYSGLQRVSRIV